MPSDDFLAGVSRYTIAIAIAWHVAIVFGLVMVAR
jgi:hypothetical protein